MIDKLLQIINRLERHPGMSVSVLMHLTLFIFLLISFPQCQRKLPPEIIISVDLLPISKMTNVENKQVAKPKKEEKPVDKPKPIEEPKPEVKEEPKPEPKPIEEAKPEPIPDKPKPKEEVKHDVQETA
jgi:outer membrane biosynthesis protein TonB